ncbi:MAG: hypothetical protein B6I20_06950 [Bacteroidetes bacterium 4572_117]|nr:MAG: hypothetical protein B6I20_06950 [Bacteroidetes bacterium 4572_117]
MANLNKILIITLFASMIIKHVSAQEKYDKNHSTHNICFDISSLESVIVNPETILLNPSKFWSDDAGYSLVKKWHEYERFTINYEAWEKKVKTYSQTPQSERKNNKFYVFATDIMKRREKFQELAQALILSFLPNNTILNTKVYFVEESRTGGFVQNGQLVLDVSKQYKKGTNYALNTLVHELFHIGYAYHRFRRSEIELENYRLLRIIDLLQNEGMATYTAYKATSVFPVHGKKNLAIENYKKSIQLNPNNENAKQMLKKLKSNRIF